MELACDLFLGAKEQAVGRGELAPASFLEYKRTCTRVARHLGLETDVVSLSPADFQSYREEMAKRWNLVGVGNEVTRVRSLFRWCHEQRLIPERLHFGPEFKKASAKALRRHRRLQGKKLYSASEVLRLLDYAGTQMRAMILLGINAGFGPTDCATLPLEALEGEWLNYPRPKTEVDRLVPLWPETLAALRESIRRRYVPQAGNEGLLFLQPDGQSWNTSTNPIAKHFRQVRQWTGLDRGGIYWLRHTFQTIGGGAKDQVAVNALMGHVDSTQAATYREEIEPERLRAVTDHVRRWLFG